MVVTVNTLAGFPRWLALREHADAAARASELLDPLRAHLADTPPGLGPVVIHDLGCGTGAMGRWLAEQLPGPQRWVLHDRDPELLAHAEANPPYTAADGTPVTVETRRTDLARLRPEDIADATLVTMSAVLDLLTAEEVDRIAAACVATGSPALLTLSVVGEVELTPADPIDAELNAAFNTHQRRVTRSRRLLGPDGADAAAAAFQRRGAAVRSRPSPWRLGAEQAELTAKWLTGWVGAACEQRPELTRMGDAVLRHRLGRCAAGELDVVVQHSDLLALPPRRTGAE